MAREGEADRRAVPVPAGSTTITPSDSAVLSPICHKLFLGNETGGNTIKLRLLDGSTPTLTLAAGNTILDVQFDMVFNTGTTLANAAIGFFPLPN
jgi:hypothetical protein